MSDRVAEKILYIISKEMGVPLHELDADARFTEELGADSLDVTTILAAIQDELHVQFDVNNIEQIKTINELIEHVRGLQAK